MEITLDVGRNVVTKLTNEAASEGPERDDFALNMMEFGLSIFENSKKKQDSGDSTLIQLMLENNAMLKDVTRCVFDRNKTGEKVFDADSLLVMVANNAKAYIKGKSEGG